MTPEELQEIERLDRLSTKGPFRINRYDCDGGAINWQVQQDHDSHGCEVIANITDDEPKRARYDAAFFVLARTLLPRLAAAFAEQTATIAALAAGVEAADLRALQAEEALAKAEGKAAK